MPPKESRQRHQNDGNKEGLRGTNAITIDLVSIVRKELQAAHEDSPLPELPGEEARAALNDLLLRVRLATLLPFA